MEIISPVGRHLGRSRGDEVWRNEVELFFGVRLEGVPGLHDITQPPGLLLDAMPMEVQLGEFYQVPGLGCYVVNWGLSGTTVVQ